MTHAIPLTRKQLSLVTTAETDVKFAIARSNAILEAITAGEDLPKGASLVSIDSDPPQLVFEVPEEPDDG